MPDGGAAIAALPDNVVFLSNVAVTTLTGGPNAGAQDGAPAFATFDNPVGITIEPAGSLVVSTFDDSKLRRISTDGVTSTLTDQASFIRPYGIGSLGGVLYVETDADPGSGNHGPQNGTMWRVDAATGAATVVKANSGKPRSFAPLSDGRLVVSDASNSTVWILDPATGEIADLAGRAGCPGSADGIGTEARFALPSGIVVLGGDRIIVADKGAHVLREVTLTGLVTTFAGDGGAGSIDGPRTSARFMGPRGLAADASGALYVSDDVDHRIRRIDADGTVITLAGSGTAGFADGPGSLAQFFGQEGVAVTADGRTVYVADGTGGSETPVPYHRIRQITIAP
jgi:sugar lactone lactonase YvrE